jgi:hypothetical protein
MSSLKGSFTSVEIADQFGVPVSTVGLVIDRLGLGHRFNRSRVVYAEDLDNPSPALRAAFTVMHDWLLAILTRGERASGTGKAGTRSSIRKGSATHQ